MREIHGLLVVFLLGTAAAAAVDNKIDSKTPKNGYCDICEDHTMCKYEGLGTTCEGSEDGGVTEEEKKYILDMHNWHRRMVAKGLETRGLNGSQPSASDMMEVTWDAELAETAQKWADQCTFEHDTCRLVGRFRVGQNIYWNWRFPVIKTVNWTAAIASWFDEVDKYDPETTQSYVFEPETGHYTQLMWHDSSLIGCGRRSYGPNKIYVCNYGPAGNFLNEPVYNSGEPCSACPDGTKCNDGLCAIPPKIDPTSYAPIDEGSGATNFSKILDPPSEDAVSVYDESAIIDTESASVTESAAVTESTELPVHWNVIDDILDITADDDIRKEIEELKKRIRKLVEKIASKKIHKD